MTHESALATYEVRRAPRPLTRIAVPGKTLSLVLAIGFTLAMALVTTLQVRAYYLTHLPHFDSIGSYIIAFQVMNAVTQSGFVSGVREATAVSLTWLQPLYALALVWLPSRAPEWLVSLNFVLMAIVQLTIAVWCGDHQYGWRKSTMLMLLPYVPGVFYAWDGGLQDWRRDIQLNVLLIGVLFLSLTHVLRPTWKRGLALGVLVGLTQWSRDNALSMIIVVALPATSIVVWQALRRRTGRQLVKIGLLPGLVFAAMAAPYYVLTINVTIARYLYSVWGPGEDRWASLARFWISPVDVLLGGSAAYNGMAATGRATLIGLAVLGLVFVACLWIGVLRIRPTGLRGRPGMTLVCSGVAVVVLVIVYNTLGLGYGAQYHGMPFVTVAVGMVAIAAGLSDAVTTRGHDIRRHRIGTVVLLVSMIGLVGLNAYRVRANEFAPAGPETVAAVRAASVQISDLASGGRVAVLWLNGFSRYHIAYFQAQAGKEMPDVTATDIEGPLRAGMRAEDLLAGLESQLRARATVVVVCQETAYYADPNGLSPFFREGKPIVDRLLADPSFRVAHQFQVAEFPMVVLQRRPSP